MNEKNIDYVIVGGLCAIVGFTLGAVFSPGQNDRDKWQKRYEVELQNELYDRCGQVKVDAAYNDARETLDDWMESGN